LGSSGVCKNLGKVAIKCSLLGYTVLNAQLKHLIEINNYGGHTFMF